MQSSNQRGMHFHILRTVRVGAGIPEAWQRRQNAIFAEFASFIAAQSAVHCA